MIFRRGNKKKMLPKLLSVFPENITSFVDFFMGSGCVSIAIAKKCKYVFANDIDDDIYNLFNVVKNNKAEFVEKIIKMPISESLFKFWLYNKETDAIWKAVRFSFLSNFSLYGAGLGIGFVAANQKKTIISKIDYFFKEIQSINFLCCDFRIVLKKTANIKGKFLYADPPYIGTLGYNKQQVFTKQDSIDLLEILVESGSKFAMSEAINDFTISMAKRYKLNIIKLGEYGGMRKRRQEVVLTNYESRYKQLHIF